MKIEAHQIYTEANDAMSESIVDISLLKGIHQIYIQANGIMGVYDRNKNLLAIKIVEKSEVIDVSSFCTEEECHILIWAFQFPIPYHFTNKEYSSSSTSECKKGFFEVYWAREYNNFFKGKIPESLCDFFREKNPNNELVSVETCIIDDNLYVTNGFLSRIINKDSNLYMSHYLPHVQNPFKTSLLSKDPLKQHQKFLFFAAMRNACNSEKTDQIKIYSYGYESEYDDNLRDYVHNLEVIMGTKISIKDNSSVYHNNLCDCEFITDSRSGVTWSTKQLKNLENAVFADMPDCEFTYENEQWYGLEKCHTTTAKYLVKNGSVICIYYDVDVF